MKFNDKNREMLVLEKTAELLFHRGIRGWNMDQLAAETGLAKNTLYRMIDSKEKVIERVILDYCRKNHTRLIEIIDREADYMEKLKSVVSEFPDYLNSFYGDFLQEVFLEYPGIESSVRSYRDEITEQMTNFLKSGIQEGYLRTDLQSEMVFDLLQAVILSFVKAGYKGEELSSKIQTGFEYLLEGIVVRQP